ncbi:MAG: 1-deoxy-D-xylulose-5-phosphate reductoisomerase, partial [Lachnospiraceae bacterium]|nr:1-deoxy-D-xylulose-5-phosphate reductoisomerase [Lachnospiraceae bacterium]
MKKIAVLGSTGSIGTQTLDIARKNPDELKITVLAAGSNVSLIEEQIREFKPEIAVLFSDEKAKELAVKVSDIPVKILSSMDGMIEAATYENVDTVVTSMVGMIGIKPTIAAIKAGKDIALANKETLVTAGHIIMPLIKEYGVSLLPVDSEHSAIFQSMNGENRQRISKILLTASGGPFRGKSYSELEKVTLEDALKHPNWAMGQKITIDSATLVNKGLEVMEAAWLFDVPVSKIQVVVHPQSVIHSMVEYEDTAVIAQLGCPDMRLPIQYALFYPDRKFLDAKKLDFFEMKSLTF